MTGKAVVCTLVVLTIATSSCGEGSPDRTAQNAAGVPPESVHRAQVTRVVDGDTIEVELDGTEVDVRYIGIDTPESVSPDQPVECFGPESSRLNARLVDGRSVTLEVGEEAQDRYGRLLAYVRLGGRLVNAALLRHGAATTMTIPPNDRFANAFERLEDRARGRQIGLWQAC